MAHTISESRKGTTIDEEYLSKWFLKQNAKIKKHITDTTGKSAVEIWRNMDYLVQYGWYLQLSTKNV